MARKKNQGSKWIRPMKRQAIYDRDQRRCACCLLTEEEGAFLTLDHVIACELTDKPDNRPENLVTMCRPCNSSKQDKTMRQWYAVLRARGTDVKAIQRRIRSAINRDWKRHYKSRKAAQGARA